jgi:tetratricopeptide (TPR) repeat protein
MLFAVRLVDLSAIEGLDLTRASNVEIVARLRQVFDFLPKETKIELANGIVTIDIPDSPVQDKSEADRLHIKAIQRAKQGDYRKAVGIWERVIELDPANVAARRNLGMAYVELQETDKARENLVEAAVLDPKDAWSFVVLGNILAKKDEWGGGGALFQASARTKAGGWLGHEFARCYLHRAPQLRRCSRLVRKIHSL